jgi:dihydroxyacetone kinase
MLGLVWTTTINSTPKSPSQCLLFVQTHTMASITLISSKLYEVAYMSFVKNSYMYTHSNIQMNRNLHKGEKLEVVEWPYYYMM